MKNKLFKKVKLVEQTQKHRFFFCKFFKQRRKMVLKNQKKKPDVIKLQNKFHLIYHLLSFFLHLFTKVIKRKNSDRFISFRFHLTTRGLTFVQN